jgi:hypothetical protein
MLKAFRICAAALLLALLAVIAPATAQFPPVPDDTSEPLVGTPKSKKGGAAAGGPNVLGNWSGQLNQVGSQAPYNFNLSVTARAAESKYPDLDCVGKLTRVGSSKSYVFFIEVITKGAADKGGRCPDGTITIARQGDELAVGWFGSIKGDTIVAYGTLKKK